MNFIISFSFNCHYNYNFPNWKSIKMDVYVLVPEREYKKREPDFSDTVSKVLKKSYSNQYAKSEAVQKAFRNLFDWK